MEIASIVASIVSVILGLLAIALSLYFYTQAKGVETNVQLALEAIKTQTNTLQSLSTRYLDRLTKYVTTPRDDSAQTAELIVTTIREIPNIVLSLRPPSDTSGEAALRRELLDAYIVLWHYSGTANIWIAAGYLPSPEHFIEADATHNRIRQIVDNSARDFRYLDALIDEVDLSQIQASNYRHLYDEAVSSGSLVGDTTEHWARRAQATP